MTKTRPAPVSMPLRMLATWFGSGLSPVAPGTMGSLAALPFAWGLLVWGGTPALLAGAAAVFVLGIPVSAAYGRQIGRDDPGEIVIDEVAGQWLALVPAGLDPVLFALGFVFFRLFDVWKPWPVSWADRSLKGGLGVMVDDILAGVLAAAAVWGLKAWGIGQTLLPGGTG